MTGHLMLQTFRKVSFNFEDNNSYYRQFVLGLIFKHKNFLVLATRFDAECNNFRKNEIFYYDALFPKFVFIVL